MKKTMIFLGLAIIMSIAGYASVMIEPGQCYSQNVFCAINQTFNTTYTFCGNACQNITAQNITMSFDLAPGETKTETSGNCKVTGICTVTQNSSHKCIIDDKTLEPGDDYRYTSQYCDLDITVDECDDASCSSTASTPTQITKELNVNYDKTDKKLKINFAGKEYSYTITESSGLEINDVVNITCPAIFRDNTEAAEKTMEYCKSVIPNYCEDLSALLIKQHDACLDREKNYETSYNQCISEKQSMSIGKTWLSNDDYSLMVIEKEQYLNSSTSCHESLGKEKEEKTGYRDMVILFIIVFLVFIGIIVAQAVKIRNLEGRSPGKEWQ